MRVAYALGWLATVNCSMAPPKPKTEVEQLQWEKWTNVVGCENQVLRRDKKNYHHCHAAWKDANKAEKIPCIVKSAVYTKLRPGIKHCRGKMVKCPQRTPIKVGVCDGTSWHDPYECWYHCPGSSCIPNSNGKKCMPRTDACRPMLRKMGKKLGCQMYKGHTQTEFQRDMCCKRCYRKKIRARGTRPVPCVMGFIRKIPQKHVGTSPYINDADRVKPSMIEKRHILCCRIKASIKSQLDAILEGPQENWKDDIYNIVYGSNQPGDKLSECNPFPCDENATCKLDDKNELTNYLDIRIQYAPGKATCTCNDGYTGTGLPGDCIPV